MNESKLRQWLLEPEHVTDLRGVAAILKEHSPSSPVELSLAFRILRNACAPPQNRQDECRDLNVPRLIASCGSKLDDASQNARLFAAQLASNLVTGHRVNAIETAKHLQGKMSALWLGPGFNIAIRTVGVSFVYQCVRAAPETVSTAALLQETAPSIIAFLTKQSTEPEESESELNFWCYSLCRLTMVQRPAMLEAWLDGLQNSEQLNNLFEIVEVAAECGDKHHSAWLWLDADDLSQQIAFDNLLALSLRTIETQMLTDACSTRAAASAAGSLLANPPPALPMPLSHPKTALLAAAAADALGPGIPKCPGRQTALLRLAATSVNGSKEAAEALRLSSGGVAAILSSTGGIDPDELTAREWGILAIRYLTEANEKVCKDISEYQLNEAKLSPELRDAGLEVSQDPTTGKPVIKRAA